MNDDLHFDPHAFAGRRSRPVDADYTQDGWTSNGVAFEDFTRMQARNSHVPRRCKRWTPAFAISPDKLRSVLLLRGWRYVQYGGRAIPDGLSWMTVNATATKKVLDSAASFQHCEPHKRRENDAHVAAVKRAGGYLELQAAIAYRAWLLGQDSVAVGESLGLQPPNVRQTLVRLCEIARDLGFETFPHHPTFKARKAERAAITERNARIVDYYNTHEVTHREVGVMFGVSRAAVRHALRKAALTRG